MAAGTRIPNKQAKPPVGSLRPEQGKQRERRRDNDEAEPLSDRPAVVTTHDEKPDEEDGDQPRQYAKYTCPHSAVSPYTPVPGVPINIGNGPAVGKRPGRCYPRRQFHCMI
jgi:hypothetical protein